MDTYDVIVVGGGTAGLAAGIALARSRRSVLVVDAGEPRNAPAAGVHNYLGLEGISPHELVARGREELRGYGGTVLPGRVVTAAEREEGFEVALADGASYVARRLILATGVVDVLPDVEGLAERWGHDVLHCPYCHGWEVRGQAIGVLATGPLAAHQALLFSQLSDRVTLLADEVALEGDALAQLAAAGVDVVRGRVRSVVTDDGALTGVRLGDGSTLSFTALVTASRLEIRGDLVASLGVETAEHPSGMGVYVTADATFQTSVPGVYVAGNLADPAAQVAGAAAAGTRTGAMVNMDLITSDLHTRRAAPA